MAIDREKLARVAALQYETRDNTMALSYAGRTVWQHLPTTPSKMQSTLDRLLDELLPHVESVIMEVTD